MNPLLTKLLAPVVALGVAFGAGYWLALEHGKVATAEALAKAEADNRKHNDEVVNGWNHAVLDLRKRIRAGDAPSIPGGVPPKAVPAHGADGRSTDNLPAAGELATCKAQRARLIEDCAMTTIQLKSLQDWAK